MTFPLTDFLLDLIGRRVDRSDPARIAREYRIREDHVRGYLAMGLGL